MAITVRKTKGQKSSFPSCWTYGSKNETDFCVQSAGNNILFYSLHRAPPGVPPAELQAQWTGSVMLWVVQ